jgi:signal transduction histidine kinase
MAPAKVILGVGCPYIAPAPATVATISLGAIVALSVVGGLLFLGFIGGGWYYRSNRIKHQQEMRILAEENEKKVKAAEHEAHLASKEQEQLRSIMGNVAHDLKTPLHSIMAEIEHLRQTIEHACESIVANDGGPSAFQLSGNAAKDVAITSFQLMSVVQKLKECTHDSFESLDTTCKFLVMAINRSQDYVKASSDIALTPILDTFNVNEVLNVVHKCMVNQKCGRVIKMHSLVSFTTILSFLFYFRYSFFM